MENNIFVLGVVFLPFAGLIIALFVQNDIISRWIGLAASASGFVFSVVVLMQNMSIGPQIYRMGGYEPPFGIVLAADMLSATFGVMASAIMMAAFLYTLHCRDKAVRQRSFISLFLAMQMGLLGGFYTGDLFTMFVFIELLVLSSVALTAISDNLLGLEAAMKYLFMSAMGSLFLLIGISSLYASFGSLNMADIAQQLGTNERPLLAITSSIGLLCAFLLKSAVFPFHFWQPDFHTTAPTPVSAVLSSVVVKLGVYGVIRLETLLFVAERDIIGSWLLILGMIGIFFGGLAALSTYNGKRMLAYSTFAQVGFILLGVGWGTPLALAAAIIYAFNHAFIKSSLLMLFGVVASRTKAKTAALADVGGVGRTLPAFVGLLYLLGGMALAGLPPMNGFVSKVALVRSGIDAQSWFYVGAAVVGGSITLMYMFRTWQLVFQQQTDEDTTKLKDPGVHDSPLAPALLISTALALGIFAGPLFTVANRTVEQISDPQIYIDAVNPANAPEVTDAGPELTLDTAEGEE